MLNFNFSHHSLLGFLEVHVDFKGMTEFLSSKCYEMYSGFHCSGDMYKICFDFFKDDEVREAFDYEFSFNRCDFSSGDGDFYLYVSEQQFFDLLCSMWELCMLISDKLNLSNIDYIGNYVKFEVDCKRYTIPNFITQHSEFCNDHFVEVFGYNSDDPF